MIDLYAAPVSWMVGSGLGLAGVYAVARGARMMAAGLGSARALDLVRGIRVLIVGFVACLAALGVLAGERGFLVMAALILAEELYETATLAAIIRLGPPEAEAPAR